MNGEEVEHSSRGELVKFLLLVGILAIVVLVVAASRPFIFGHVVPAVMGEGRPAAALPDTIKEPVDEMETAVPVEDSTPAETEPGTETETDASNDAEAEQRDVGEMDPDAFPTALPATTHVVQSGQTLFAIARIYGVTVDDIARANNITNPDRLDVGVTLLIPVGER